MVRSSLHWVAAILVAAVVLTGCTRNRPTPEPVANAGVPDAPVVVTPAQQPANGVDSAAEPQVVTSTLGSEVAQSVTPEATPASGSASGSQIIQYTVQSGDTLSQLAVRFGAEMDALRRMNFLVDDNIRVGQVLRIPLGEGYTTDGPPTPTPTVFGYEVQVGDTLYGIARRFGVEATSIIEANNLLDQNNLTVGQTLIIPDYQPSAADTTEDETAGESADVPPSGSSSQVVHIVQPGEGLLLIAEKYGVSASAIAEANNIQNRELLRVGQRLFIPGITPEQAAAANQVVHIVQPGEGLLEIAVLYGVSAQEIAELNELQNTDLIYPGQQLLIPLN